MQHRAPGVADQRVSPGHIGGGLVPGGGGTHGEALVIYRTLTQEQFPVGGAGGHVEGRGSQQDTGTLQSHEAAQLLEPEVEADAQAYSAIGCVEEGDVVPRRQGGGLAEGLAALHVDVEQVHFPVAGHAGACGVENVGGVIDLVTVQLGEGTAYQPEV